MRWASRRVLGELDALVFMPDSHLKAYAGKEVWLRLAGQEKKFNNRVYQTGQGVSPRDQVNAIQGHWADTITDSPQECDSLSKGTQQEVILGCSPGREEWKELHKRSTRKNTHPPGS